MSKKSTDLDALKAALAGAQAKRDSARAEAREARERADSAAAQYAADPSDVAQEALAEAERASAAAGAKVTAAEGAVSAARSALDTAERAIALDVARANVETIRAEQHAPRSDIEAAEDILAKLDPAFGARLIGERRAFYRAEVSRLGAARSAAVAAAAEHDPRAIARGLGSAVRAAVLGALAEAQRGFDAAALARQGAKDASAALDAARAKLSTLDPSFAAPCAALLAREESERAEERRREASAIATQGSYLADLAPAVAIIDVRDMLDAKRIEIVRGAMGAHKEAAEIAGVAPICRDLDGLAGGYFARARGAVEPSYARMVLDQIGWAPAWGSKVGNIVDWLNTCLDYGVDHARAEQHAKDLGEQLSHMAAGSDGEHQGHGTKHVLYRARCAVRELEFSRAHDRWHGAREEREATLVSLVNEAASVAFGALRKAQWGHAIIKTDEGREWHTTILGTGDKRNARRVVADYLGAPRDMIDEPSEGAPSADYAEGLL